METIALSEPERPRPRLAAHDLITEAQLAEVRRRSPWRGLAMVAHAWATIGAAIAVVALWPNPLTAALAIMVIGSRQLGLAILMHDGAHGALHPNERVNLWVSQWLCAYPIGAETRAYRRYHMQHHAHTQTDRDPDLVLSKPFPITPASYRRKFWRDISGRTGFDQRAAQIRNAMGPADLPRRSRWRSLSQALGRQIIANGVLCAAMALAGVWWAYPLLWVLPLLTWYQVVTRVRNIAEHAVVSDNEDPLRNTRTTRANRLERLFLAPYYVNFHLEHHLFFYIPAYNLPRIHAWLMAGPLRDRLEVAQSYATVMAKATAGRPETVHSDGRPGRAAGSVDRDRVRGGF